MSNILYKYVICEENEMISLGEVLEDLKRILTLISMALIHNHFIFFKYHDL